MKTRLICTTCHIDRILLGFPRGSAVCWFCIRVNEITRGKPHKTLKIKAKDLRPPKKEREKLPDDPVLRRERRRQQQKRSRVKKFQEKIATPRGYLQYMIDSAQSRSKRDNLAFDLTVDGLMPMPTHCPVLGIEFVRGTGGAHDASPSLDRVDPTKGYTLDNVVIISMRANRAKSDLSLAEIRALAFYCEHPPWPIMSGQMSFKNPV